LAKVVWTAEAEQWLRRIHDYIARDKPAAAFGVIESLYRRAEILAQFPEIGHVHTTPSGRDVRILLWGHYRIVYLQRGADEVHILGVFHGAMDLRHYVP
jgi:plasmid stabilization system protein ParE